ncbi:MAG: OmpA family protein [Cyanobacteria bacterium P01_H01_bin.74]
MKKRGSLRNSMQTRQFRLDHRFFVDDGGGAAESNRWMLPYADLLTVLIGFILVVSTTGLQTSDSGKPEGAASESVQVKAIKTNAARTNLVKTNAIQPNTMPVGSFLATADQSAATTKTIPHTAASTESQSKENQATENQTAENQTKEEYVAQHRDAVQQMIHQEMTGLIDSEAVTVSENNRGWIISFKDRILFEPGSDTLTPEALDTLAKLTPGLQTILSKYPHPVRVEGHTDNSPIETSQFPSNWELSAARATRIVRYLTETAGLSPALLSAAGYGQFRPLAKNSSVEGKRNNRRVDIVILSGQSQLVSQNPGSDPKFRSSVSQTSQ